MGVMARSYVRCCVAMLPLEVCVVVGYGAASCVSNLLPILIAECELCLMSWKRRNRNSDRS